MLTGSLNGIRRAFEPSFRVSICQYDLAPSQIRLFPLLPPSCSHRTFELCALRRVADETRLQPSMSHDCFEPLLRFHNACRSLSFILNRASGPLSGSVAVNRAAILGILQHLASLSELPKFYRSYRYERFTSRVSQFLNVFERFGLSAQSRSQSELAVARQSKAISFHEQGPPFAARSTH